ncbi:MAG: hypothetical protein ACR2M6_03260 [Vampirovibrionia bacterium]|jgi:hypothetical protein
MDINTRASEIIKIFKKLIELNLGIDCFDEFNTFREISNKFIKDGIHVQGQIKVLGTKRIICYTYGKKVDCMLKYDDSV